MVCAFGAALAIAGLIRLRSIASAVRGTLAVVAALSGFWLMVVPRADQPLLDGAEHLAPELRSTYMSEGELEIYRDAHEHAERYRREGEQLNEREARSRWQGKALDEMEVRRMSSFLKSYGEMRKGEEFVKREVRARARERERWLLGGGLLLAAVALFPWRRKGRP
jgi:zinc/manganese transport system permease protein